MAVLGNITQQRILSQRIIGKLSRTLSSGVHQATFGMQNRNTKYQGEMESAYEYSSIRSIFHNSVRSKGNERGYNDKIIISQCSQ